jgi:Fe-S cluster assembly ATPase SufC
LFYLQGKTNKIKTMLIGLPYYSIYLSFISRNFTILTLTHSHDLFRKFQIVEDQGVFVEGKIVEMGD